MGVEESLVPKDVGRGRHVRATDMRDCLRVGRKRLAGWERDPRAATGQFETTVVLEQRDLRRGRGHRGLERRIQVSQREVARTALRQIGQQDERQPQHEMELRAVWLDEGLDDDLVRDVVGGRRRPGQ